MAAGFVSILLAVIVIQLLLFSIFLFTQQKGRRQSHLLLGFLFLSFCLNLADGFLLYQRVYFNYPAFALWGTAFTLAFGPLLFLYTRSALFKDYFFKAKDVLHFVPFTLLLMLTCSAYIQLPQQEKIKLLDKILSQQMHGIYDIASLLIFLHFFMYLFGAWQLAAQYKKMAADKFSDLQKNNVQWLHTLHMAFLLFFALGFLKTFIYLTPFARLYYFVFALLVALMFVFVNRVVLKALNNPALFTSLEEKETLPTQTDAALPKYRGSAIEENEKELLKEKIIKHMEQHRPYLEPELSLDELAAQLQMKPRALSQVINESIGQTFFDFINQYRINEAKKMLDKLADPKITVQEVLYAVGFNSKSSFNTIFKKQTGFTPSEFKRQSMQKRSDIGAA